MATPDWLPESSDWQSWSLPAFPTALSTGVQTLGSLTQAVTSVLTIAKTTLEALSAVQLARVDLTQLAVTAAVTAIDTALKALESDTGVYLLLAPPRRRVVVPTVVQAALVRLGLPSIPAGPIDLKVAELQTAALKQGLDPVASQMLRQATSATGGSGSFLRTLLESLTDQGDPSRPQLPVTDYVAGGVLISGAPDYGSLLSFLLALDSLVGPGRPATALNAPDIPTPQDLKVQKLAVGAQLSWKPRPVAVTLPALNSLMTLPEIAVIRSTNSALLFGRSPMDVFGTTKLTEGLTAGKATVLKVLNNVATLNAYLDETIEMVDTPYYYALSYRLNDIDGNDLGFGPMSNAVKLIYGTTRASTRAGGSTPPDWVRFPRAIDLIPGMAKVFDFIRSAGTSFKGASLGADVSLKAYTAFLDQLVSQYTKYADTATTAVNQLSALANTNIQAGVGLYSFQGSGGNPFVVKSMAAAVSQLKFTDTHFVGGAVILVAGPSPAVVQPVWSIIELLLGTGQAESNIFTKALAGLNDQLQVLKAQTLGDDFKPGTSASAITSSIPSEGCTPFEPTIPTLKDDFTP